LEWSKDTTNTKKNIANFFVDFLKGSEMDLEKALSENKTISDPNKNVMLKKLKEWKDNNEVEKCTEIILVIRDTINSTVLLQEGVELNSKEWIALKENELKNFNLPNLSNLEKNEPNRLFQMLTINDKKLTATEAKYHTNAGYVNWAIISKLPAEDKATDPFEKLKHIQGEFFLQKHTGTANEKSQATFFKLLPDLTKFSDTSANKLEVVIHGNHLEVNKLLAYEVGGMTMLGESKEKDLKKENPEFIFDKEKTKENIDKELSKFTTRVSYLWFDDKELKTFFSEGYPSYMKHLNFQNIIEKAFILDTKIDSKWDPAGLKNHTRKLRITDGQRVQDLGQDIEWTLDTDKVKLLPKERTNPVKITVLGKEFFVNIVVADEKNPDLVKIQWTKEQLTELKKHWIDGYELAFDAINDTNHVDRTAHPDLAKTGIKQNKDRTGKSIDKGNTIDSTKLDGSLLSYTIKLGKESEKDRKTLSMVPNAEAKSLQVMDAYGHPVNTYQEKNGKNITQETEMKKGTELHIGEVREKVNLVSYEYLSYEGDSQVVKKLQDSYPSFLKAENKVQLVNKSTHKALTKIPVVYDKKEGKTIKYGYTVDMVKLNDEVKSEHFYDYIDELGVGAGIPVSNHMLHSTFDAWFQSYSATEKGKKDLKWLIVDGKFHKVSEKNEGRTLALASVRDSIPQAVRELREKMQTYLNACSRVWNAATDARGMSMFESKISGKLGAERYFVDGRSNFVPDRDKNDVTLVILDGDHNARKIEFEIKGSSIALKNKETTIQFGEETKKVDLKDGKLVFSAVKRIVEEPQEEPQEKPQ